MFTRVMDRRCWIMLSFIVKELKQHVFGDDVTDCRPYVAQRCVGTPSPAKWTGDVP